ncbi:unnamed protein product [Rotaria sp. Silwood2]|nr:unnamed protein product [Rotaria sp. Silwood2]CAF4368149.1 unnamed protein product [Rotaria sp. Silwood2]
MHLRDEINELIHFWEKQVRSLSLSNADDTCRQIHLFFGLFYIGQFVNLESLVLIEIPEQDLNKVVTKFNLLSKLSYLSIKLAHGLMPKITAPSLKYLSIGICSMSQLQQLLLSTPILTKLDVQLIADTTPADITFLPPTITTEILQLKNKIAEKSNITFNDITVLFAWMPKLNKFTFIAAKGVKFIRGEQWEYRIRTYLPQLKEFRFKTHPHLYDTNIEQLLAIFQTSFWLKEHQWFVNCDHHHLPYIGYLNPRNVHLYTLPYSDEQFYLSLSTKTLTNVCKDEYCTIKNLYFSIDYQSL